MALLERVSTLIRANLNDLVDKAEDPEKMIKQVILDMENQLLQVKTQVAISIADQHVLERKLKESEESAQQWVRRAELAVDKQDDALARAAVERSMSYQIHDRELPPAGGRSENAGGESEDGAPQAAAEAGGGAVEERHADRPAPPFARPRQSHRRRPRHRRPIQRRRFRPHEEKVQHTEATATAKPNWPPTMSRTSSPLEKEDEIDRLLAEIKSKRKAG